MAWATTTNVLDAGGVPSSTTVAMGVLWRPASASFSIARSEGGAGSVAAGPVALVFVHGADTTRIDVYRAADGTRLARLEVDGGIDELTHVAVDPAREVLYAGVALPGGEVDIRRIALDGSASTSLISLDARFTPDAIPTDHYGLVVATDGRLVVAACERGSCRLWRVAPGRPAGRPVTLPGREECDLVGATDRWVVAYDEDMCCADTGDAPFPFRAISLADASNHLISDASQVMARRVLVVDGQATAIASHRSPDWSTSDIESYDVRTGAVTVLLAGLANGQDGPWLGVSRQVLPDPWVLLEPWAVYATTASTLPARLLNVVTGEVIELPIGTAGWG